MSKIDKSTPPACRWCKEFKTCKAVGEVCEKYKLNNLPDRELYSLSREELFEWAEHKDKLGNASGPAKRAQYALVAIGRDGIPWNVSSESSKEFKTWQGRFELND